MGNLALLAPQLDASSDGSRPLARRLERIAALLAAGEYTQQQVATACRTSRASITRLNRQPAFRARLRVLRQQLADAALEDEPLALKGNRIAVAGKMIRSLNQQLEENDFEATLGVSKQGNPIVGFDRARVSEVRQYLSYMEGALEPKPSTIVESTQLGVSITLDQATTRIQALLSRTQPDTTHMEGAREDERE
jgi:hypothetical protein